MITAVKRIQIEKACVSGFLAVSSYYADLNTYKYFCHHLIPLLSIFDSPFPNKQIFPPLVNK